MKAEMGQGLRAGNYAGQSPPGANTSAMPETPFAGAHHYAISFRGTAPILLQSRSLSCFGRPCWEKGGFTFLLSLVSGIVTYASFMRRQAFGTVRQDRRPRWLDLHNLVGIATVLWLIAVGGTGVVNTPQAHPH
jgi:hypothetical protein